MRILLREHRDIISSVESIEIRATGKLMILRMKLTLVDGSLLFLKMSKKRRDTYLILPIVLSEFYTLDAFRPRTQEEGERAK